MALVQVPGTNLLWDQSSGYAFEQNGEDPISSLRSFSQADFDAAGVQNQQALSKVGSNGLTKFGGQVTRGLRGEYGGENASWGINPKTGQEEPVIEGFLLSDLLGKYGSIEGIRQAEQSYNPELVVGGQQIGGNEGRFSGALDRFNTRPSNDTFSGKDGLQDLATIALMASAAFTGGYGLGGAETGVAGTTAAGTAGFEGGVGAAGASGSTSGALGGGLSTGSTASGIGGGQLGTGLTAGTSAGVGGEALGTGITSGGAAGGAGTVAGGSILGGTGAASAGGLGSILSNPQALGAALGAGASLFGGGSKPAGTTTTVQDIPEWLKPYAQQGLSGLQTAYNATPNGVAPVTEAGNQYLQDVIGGNYLNNNPYLDSMFDRAAGKVTAGVNSQFSSAGRYGSGAHTGVLTEGLGNLATDIYGKNYATERANQQAAAGGSAAFGNAYLQQPFIKGQQLLNGVNSIKGGTTTNPYFQNQTADVLSGAVGGSVLGKYFL